MENTIQRGNIYLIDFGLTREGQITSGFRPGIVVSNNIGNRFSTILTVIPCSTSTRSNLPVHVSLHDEDMEEGMILKASTLQCEQVRVINTYSIGQLIGKVTPQKMNDIEEALLLSLGMSVKSKIKVLL